MPAVTRSATDETADQSPGQTRGHPNCDHPPSCSLPGWQRPLITRRLPSTTSSNALKMCFEVQRFMCSSVHWTPSFRRLWEDLENRKFWLREEGLNQGRLVGRWRRRCPARSLAEDRAGLGYLQLCSSCRSVVAKASCSLWLTCSMMARHDWYESTLQ